MLIYHKYGTVLYSNDVLIVPMKSLLESCNGYQVMCNVPRPKYYCNTVYCTNLQTEYYYFCCDSHISGHFYLLGEGGRFFIFRLFKSIVERCILGVCGF